MVDLTETLGDRLKQVRGDMSQVDFAARLGADKNTVGRYERGERQPDADFLIKLHSAFCVSIDWLLTGNNTTPSPPPVADTTVPKTKDRQEIDRLYVAAMTAVLAWYDRSDLTAAPDIMAGIASLAVRSVRAERDTASMSDEEVIGEVTRGLDMANSLLRESGWKPKKG